MDSNEKKTPNFRYVTEEEIKALEDEIDMYSMKRHISVKNKVIKTYGQLRPYIKSTKVARKFEDILHEDDFEYFFMWILEKELDEERKKSKNK
jgi:hypothetical protein